jgi:branched-chain amino acid transport system permease protein
MPEPGSTELVAQREASSRRALTLLATAFFGIALLFAAAAWIYGDTFYLRLGTEALTYACLALSVDILLGYTGLLSLGQALYFGLGAYVSALVLKEVAPSMALAVAASLGAATVTGAIGGYIAIRARGVYFALITFGLAQIVAKAVYNTRSVGASDGIVGIPIVNIEFGVFTVSAGDPAGFFLFLLAITIALYAGCAYLMETPFGRLLIAIRVNEARVPFLGFTPRRYKLAAYVLAANVAALGGAFYPMLRGFVSPELLFFAVSGNAVIGAIVGGMGTLIGPILGAVGLTALRSLVSTITEHHLIIIGVIFMLSVILLPSGVVGFIRARSARHDE